MSLLKMVNISGKRNLVLAVGMIGILLVLFVPISPVLLDLLLITNFSFGLLIFLLTFYSEKPLSFSTFPSLLLITTLFRLSLNIAATRLILADADAGKVIGAIGSYVVGGNYVIGLVVFLILVVVQYVVVTNGAQRVAEVAARFTLDSMPGKQMSIDADLNMGIIDQNQAQKRRSEIEKEANFYGAMDGATKFVKGDAIAGIIIILIDIIGGLSVGVVQHGLNWSDALHTYTLLTVGDGIVTQIPSLVIAVATGIIITRAATDSELGAELASQIIAHPRSLFVVTAALLGVIFLPGLPAFPAFILFSIFAALTYYASTHNPNDVETMSNEMEETQPNDDFQSVLRVTPIEIKIGTKLGSFMQEDGQLLLEQIGKMRKQYAIEFGYVIPEIKVVDSVDVGGNEYEVILNGDIEAKGNLHPDKLMAISTKTNKTDLKGIPTTEPAYQLPALWIEHSDREYAKVLGYTVVEPDTVIVTHINEVLKRAGYQLISRKITEEIVSRIKNINQGLLDELVPNLMTYSDIQRVLKALVKEKVSVRNIEAILEALAESSAKDKSTDFLVEQVRKRLSKQICQKLVNSEGVLKVISIDPVLENKLVRSVKTTGEEKMLLLEPKFMDKLAQNIVASAEKIMKASRTPVIVCTPGLRLPFKKFIDRMMPVISVISLAEVPDNMAIQSVELLACEE